MEADAAEAEHGVARSIWLGNVDVAALQRGLERVDALLRIVRHHRQLGGSRRRSRRDLERRASVSREQPRRQDGAAAAPVKVLAAGVLHAAEELRR